MTFISFRIFTAITAIVLHLLPSEASNLLAQGSLMKKKHHRKAPVLKVAMVCPLDEEKFAANAADAASGWEAWLNASKGEIKVGGKKVMKVHSTTIRYTKETLVKATQQVSAGKFHLVIGCSTHYFGEVVAALQVIKVPNLQCNAGNPFIWTKLAEMAKKDMTKLYGYGLHAPFTDYPVSYLKMVHQAFHTQLKDGKYKKSTTGDSDAKFFKGVERPLKVALVMGQPNQFTASLCASAMRVARKLKLDVIGGDYIFYNDLDQVTEAAKQADILYGCTLLKDGMSVMEQISNLKPADRPRAVSLSVAPSKEEMFVDEFGKQAAYVSYPSQWHSNVAYSCDAEEEDDDYKCPSTFASTQSYLSYLNETIPPSYDKASCSAAGVVLEVAAKSLDADFAKKSLKEQRELLHEALGDVETDSFFGSIEFDEDSHMNTGLDVVIAQYQPTGDLGKVRSFAVTNATFELRHTPPPVSAEVPKSGALGAGIPILVFAFLSFLI